MVVRRSATALLIAAAALTGCSDDQAAAPSSSRPEVPFATPDPPPTTAPPRTSPPGAPAGVAYYDGVRGTIPHSTDPCTGDPPFRFAYLPAGFTGQLVPYRNRPGPRQPDDVMEPYDPLFWLGGAGGAYLHLHHGNSWRLTPTPQQDITLLGRPAAVSLFDHGVTIVEFRVAATGSHCDWWAVSGNVSAEEVVAVARQLRLPS